MPRTRQPLRVRLAVAAGLGTLGCAGAAVAVAAAWGSLAGVLAAAAVAAGAATVAGLWGRSVEVSLRAAQLRAQVADELAEHQRRSARAVSAGMFELLSGLVSAEEGTRGQLSAELHDTVAQTLMQLRARVAALLEERPAGELEKARASDLGYVGELLAEAEEQVRSLMARTRPPQLRDGDLARAVMALRDDMGHRYGLAVDVSWPAEPVQLPLATAVTLYRFFQEALLNVVKHADVDGAHASLRVEGDAVVAVVADDGPGFDPATVRPDGGRHVGLGLLRERVRLAGGRLTVRSWPDPGTTVTLLLPRGTALQPVRAGAGVLSAGGGLPVG